jgi:hypothetical protein
MTPEMQLVMNIDNKGQGGRMLRPGQAFKTRLRSKNKTFYARRDQMKAESRNRWRT